ncbi:hypothetical protein SLS53_005466 [Cytospora paraplurivora]|uniref:Uncharacterized protein n=1 Tax=Cytospora paraplurivora TaxID=2898453 RepID=A0AAN9YG62_9PEZI
MVMDARTRCRPSLEVKTDYAASGEYPRTAFRTHRSPLPSATPITPKPLPSPLQPSTPRYDASMMQHERVMVESLDTGGRRASRGGDKLPSGLMSAVAEQIMATRVNNMTMNSPIQYSKPVLPVRAPDPPRQRSPSAQTRQTIVDETRSMLLSGMSPTQANDLEIVANRRLSAPADVTQEKRRQSLLLLRTDKLQTWGHVYFGDPSKADVFVAPAALRRLSGTDSVEDDSQPDRLVIRARFLSERASGDAAFSQHSNIGGLTTPPIGCSFVARHCQLLPGICSNITIKPGPTGIESRYV